MHTESTTLETRAFTAQATERCALSAHVVQCGSDLAIALYGGSHHHVGAVALAQPEDDPVRQATVSVLCAYGHRDDEVARRMAKRIAGELGCTVSVSVGIHINDASPDEIAAIISVCDSLADAICEASGERG